MLSSRPQLFPQHLKTGIFQIIVPFIHVHIGTRLYLVWTLFPGIEFFFIA
jgi:hypothetical protein